MKTYSLRYARSLLAAPVESVSRRDRHFAASVRARMHLEAAHDPPTVEQPVVAVGFLPMVELLQLEIIDADDLAAEVAWTLGHDPGKRMGSSPPAPVGDIQILGL